MAVLTIRPETLSDHVGIHALNISTFETIAEANLVDALREQSQSVVSLVAEEASADHERAGTAGAG